jgi:uncharacterized protein YjbJ (UPF0337 family)
MSDPKILRLDDPKYGRGEKQVDNIIAYLKEQLNDGKTPIGLIYSANNDQALQIHKARTNGEPIPAITGGGQAKLFGELAKRINNDPQLKGQVKIYPIATSLHGGNNVPGNQVNETHIHRDLNEISAAVNDKDNPCLMMGLTDGGHFAIGGGVSKHWNKDRFEGLSNKTQGEFVEAQLQAISNGKEYDYDLANNAPFTTKFNNDSSLGTAANQLMEEAKKGYDAGLLDSNFEKEFREDVSAIVNHPNQNNIENLNNLVEKQENKISQKLPSTFKNALNYFVGAAKKAAGLISGNKKWQAKGETQLNQAKSASEIKNKFKEFKAKVKEERQKQEPEPGSPTMGRSRQ